MSHEVLPTVRLDGAAVRRIREDSKLTQLYVAKVVGVTTDTISRWENNRYPSVRRDNAVRLAEALEVPVEDVLEKAPETGEQEEAGAEPESAESPSDGRRVSSLIAVAAVLLLLLVGGAIWYAWGDAEPAWSISAERVLLPYAAPGHVYPVRVRLKVEGEGKGFILREHFPIGWKLVEANPPASSLDNEEGTVRWIIKPGEPRSVISYLVQVSPDADFGALRDFQGEVVAGGSGHRDTMQVGGDRSTKISRTIWADLDGDNVVDDAEMLEASDTFDEMRGVHLNWSQLEQIWDAGFYQWDQDKHRFVPAEEPQS